MAKGSKFRTVHGKLSLSTSTFLLLNCLLSDLPKFMSKFESSNFLREGKTTCSGNVCRTHFYLDDKKSHSEYKCM